MKSMIIPVGENCAPANWLKLWKLRSSSYPLDWLKRSDEGKYDLDLVFKLFYNKFANFFKEVSIFYRSTPDGSGKFSNIQHIAYDKDNELYDLHIYDKILKNPATEFETYDEYHNLVNKRISRMYQDIQRSELIILLSMRKCSVSRLLQVTQNFEGIFGKKVVFINVNFDEKNEALRLDRFPVGNGSFMVNIIFDENNKTDFLPWFGVGTMHRNSANLKVIEDEVRFWNNNN